MQEQIERNLIDVRRRIELAAQAAGRQPDRIRLVGVTKYVESAAARCLVNAGCRDLGESRPQTLWDKAAALSDLNVTWHLVGPLQRNKIRRTLPLVTLIHSVNSLRLAETIDRVAGEMKRSIDVLIEVNVSNEAAKQGFGAEGIEPALQAMALLRWIRVKGLMGMSGLQSEPDERRREFAALRRLAERLKGVVPPQIEMSELSMGMSDDFEAAIAEGATIVRLGSVLFAECGLLDH
jgi:pyridoxal phosphate enzyme (YggS family)